MSIFGACMLFVVFILVYVMIAEVFTVLFRFTGLTAEKARFQVVSLLTNSGFTTKESELIVADPKRRRLARATMLFGYAFTVTIVSAVVNIFLALKLTEIQRVMWELSVPLLLLFGIVFLIRNRLTRGWFDDQIEKAAHRIMHGHGGNQLLVLDYYHDKVIAQITLTNLPGPLADLPLSQAGLKETYDVLVMLLRRKGASQAVEGATVLHAGDVIVVFGKAESVKKAFAAA